MALPHEDVLRSWVPRFHVTAEHNWLNDPNGLIQAGGDHHVFFQENPLTPFWGVPHWGHVSSRDLVTWTRHERALSPVPGGPDADGCWSGCARMIDGVPYLYYTGVVGDGADRVESVCRAAGSADLLRWTRDPGNPLIPGPPGTAPTGYHRDPFLWRDDGGWHLILASGTAGPRGHGTVLVYDSPDARTWTYGGVLFADPGDRPGRVAEHWECGQLLLFPDAAVLIVSVQQPMAERPLSYVDYFVGELAGTRFHARRRGRLDGGRTLYAPAVTVDEQGRHLLWGWAQEELPTEVQRHLPAAGALTLPRVLTVAGDELRSTPAPELAGLRAGAVEVPLPADGSALPLAGGQLVLEAAVAGSGGTVEVRLGDEAGTDELRVTLRPGRGLEVTATDAAGRPRTHRVATPAPGGPLTIYRDGSLVEVFCGGAAVTTRWYTAGAAETVARLRTRGPVTASATAWRLRDQDWITPAGA
jgi:beta-fructofuranosidase